MRAEFFNLFNRANFGIPVRLLEAPGFGLAIDEKAFASDVKVRFDVS